MPQETQDEVNQVLQVAGTHARETLSKKLRVHPFAVTMDVSTGVVTTIVADADETAEADDATATSQRAAIDVDEPQGEHDAADGVLSTDLNLEADTDAVAVAELIQTLRKRQANLRAIAIVEHAPSVMGELPRVRVHLEHTSGLSCLAYLPYRKARLRRGVVYKGLEWEEVDKVVWTPEEA